MTAILAKLSASAALEGVGAALTGELDETPELPEELLDDPPAEFRNDVVLDPHADKSAAIPM